MHKNREQRQVEKEFKILQHIRWRMINPVAQNYRAGAPLKKLKNEIKEL
jgi:hypothetical protein